MDYFKQHWDGKNTLVHAFWINGVLVSILLGALAVALFWSLGQTFMTVYILVLALIWIWQGTGIYLSAQTYLADAKTSESGKTTFWGYAAIVVVAINSLNVITDLLNSAF